MNLVAEFKRRIAPKPQTYAIYKRTTAGLNKRVFWNLSAEEAEETIALFPARVKGLCIEFYEIIPEGHVAEGNVYWNPAVILKDEVAEYAN